ncbi:MAG: hypothetical protein JO342_08660 [Solirubrobacterales bacterium]|nr:hypothetical protein [Solirubrobacterales bacterium]
MTVDEVTWRELLDRVEDPRLDDWVDTFGISRADAVIEHLKMIVSIAEGAIEWIDEPIRDRADAGGVCDTVGGLKYDGELVARWFGRAWRLLNDKGVAA